MEKYKYRNYKQEKSVWGKVMSEEKWILSTIYNVFNKHKLYHSQSAFYDCFLEPPPEDYEVSTKGKAISGTRDFYKREKEYYAKKENKDKALNHLKELVKKAGNKNEKIAHEIIKIIKRKNPNELEQLSKLERLLTYLAKQQSDEFYVFFYYELFKYLVAGIIGDIGTYDVIAKAYKEFYEDIVKYYGISGDTAAMIILQRAQRLSTTNPIILYEAAEIEIKKSKICANEKKADHIQNAYDYYYRAYENGLPLAGWNLGHLAQKDGMAQHIKQYGGETEEKRLEIAKKYFVEAAEAGCIRAINSLGNIYMSRLSDKEKTNPDFNNANYKKAKDYYKRAAEQNEVHGMYNYGRILEKEIKMLIENKIAKLSKINDKVSIKKIFKEHEIQIKDMISYYEKAANEGYPPACYRYALYTCGVNLEIRDMIFPKNIKFPISKERMWTTDCVRAIHYFELAKKTATDKDLPKKITKCLKKVQAEDLEKIFEK